MIPAVETAAWVAGIWMAIALAAWIRHRRQQRRTARVHARRAQRLADIQARLEQFRIDDTELADALARWSDDMNKQQREEG